MTTAPAVRGELLRVLAALLAGVLTAAGCAADSASRHGRELSAGPLKASSERPHGAVDDPADALAGEAPSIWERLRAGFALPPVDHPSVQRALSWHTSHPLYLEAMWQRAERYLHYILEEVERRGMPTEVALLPVVESGFRPQAVSSSAAAGLWQFVPGTGRHLGLRQDAWEDQRLDVLTSTDAALDYLETLNSAFGGDWLLTLAAYNGGPGYVAKVQKANQARGRGTRFEDLPLRKETRTYVWRMLALQRLVQDPEQYGVTLPPLASVPYFEILEAPHQIDVGALAAIEELSSTELTALNPGLQRGVTPPDGPHRVLVPVHAASAVQARLAEPAPVVTMADGAPPVVATHTVRRGENLTRLARHYGTTVAELQRLNALPSTRLKVGQSLRVPQQDPGNSAQAGQTADAATRTVAYRVRPGDTLTRIGHRFGVSLGQLLDLNANLSPSARLLAGQRITLIVPH